MNRVLHFQSHIKHTFCSAERAKRLARISFRTVTYDPDLSRYLRANAIPFSEIDWYAAIG